MAILVTLQNHRDAEFPVDERTYRWAECQPAEGQQIHLHDQARLVNIDRVVWMSKPWPGNDRSMEDVVSSCVVVVTPNAPRQGWDGRYS